ncbi:carboxymuconolactone decarboxylase family protein [Arhodomonas sp. AD133]|uniref:carboxymuconolactone decarboxylase family protein n=1 Tax=Arhodomonas sp. AD133 TaxID=3415009 RepID=UPI003EBC16A0
MTEPRVDFPRLGQRVYHAMLSINTYLEGCSIPEALVELVNLRISQINGCAFCLDKHTAALIERGEDSRRLATLAAWADSPLFDERERAALRWAETLTRLHGDGPTEHCYCALREHFDEQEAVDLTFAITTMNAWNRVSRGFGLMPPR